MPMISIDCFWEVRFRLAWLLPFKLWYARWFWCGSQVVVAGSFGSGCPNLHSVWRFRSPNLSYANDSLVCVGRRPKWFHSVCTSEFASIINFPRGGLSSASISVELTAFFIFTEFQRSRDAQSEYRPARWRRSEIAGILDLWFLAFLRHPVFHRQFGYCRRFRFAQCNTIKYDAIRCNTTQYTIQYYTTR